MTPDNAFFWEGAARGELLAQRCADCGTFRHPPRPMCYKCRSTRTELARLSGGARLNSWIVPRYPPPLGFAEPPIVALVELDEGLRLVSNVVGETPQTLQNGMRLRVEFAPTAGGKAVPVFRRAS
jgi:uncharacterized OB-fold protein